jgi:hypothetical protein
MMTVDVAKSDLRLGGMCEASACILRTSVGGDAGGVCVYVCVCVCVCVGVLARH